MLQLIVVKRNCGIPLLLFFSVLIPNILFALEELIYYEELTYHIEYHEAVTNDGDEFDTPDFQASHRTTAYLRLRENPGTTSPIITTLDSGTEVQLLEIGPTAFIGVAIAPWVKVTSADGDTGWCFSGYLEIIQELFFTEAEVEELTGGIIPIVLNPENLASIVAENNVDTVAPDQSLPPWVLIATAGVIGGAGLAAGGLALLAAKRRRR